MNQDTNPLLIEAISTLRSAERRLDNMSVEEVETQEGKSYKAILPDNNILSYELSVMAEKLEEEVKASE